MKKPKPDRLLLLAGKLADAARNVAGGPGLNFMVRPATVCELSARCEELRQAVDAYDAEILERARRAKR